MLSTALVPYDGGGRHDAGDDDTTAPHINMSELLSTRRAIAHRKHNVYKSVLALCHRRIRHNARTRPDQTWCAFQIPTFVPGLPRFNLDECTRYCLAKLRENGFDITFYLPDHLD